MQVGHTGNEDYQAEILEYQPYTSQCLTPVRHAIISCLSTSRVKSFQHFHKPLADIFKRLGLCQYLKWFFCSSGKGKGSKPYILFLGERTAFSNIEQDFIQLHCILNKSKSCHSHLMLSRKILAAVEQLSFHITFLRKNKQVRKSGQNHTFMFYC